MNQSGSAPDVYSEWTEPALWSSCSGASASFWDGLGGWNNTELGQDGTAIGNTGLPNHEVWAEVWPQQPMIGLGVTFGPNSLIDANTGWYSGSFSGSVDNGNTGVYRDWSHAGPAPGPYAEAIAERTQGANGYTALANFGRIFFDYNAASTSYNGPLNTFNTWPTNARDQITMLSNAGSKITSETGFDSNGGFYDTYINC